MDVCFDCLGSKKGLTKPANAFIRVDGYPQNVGEFIEAQGLNSCDFHIEQKIVWRYFFISRIILKRPALEFH